MHFWLCGVSFRLLGFVDSETSLSGRGKRHQPCDWLGNAYASITQNQDRPVYIERREIWKNTVDIFQTFTGCSEDVVHDLYKTLYMHIVAQRNQINLIRTDLGSLRPGVHPASLVVCIDS